MVTVTESKPIDSVVQIYSPRFRAPADFPTPGEFKQLSILVLARCSGLREGVERDLAFKNTFLALLFANRRQTVDDGKHISYWTQAINAWLHANDVPGETNHDALLAAAIVHGIAWDGPAYAKLGLTLGSTIDALPSRWREVLATGRVPDPTPAVVREPVPLI